MRQLNRGEIEVVVLVDGLVINGPDHRSLGPQEAGARVITAEGPYADSLREDELVAFLEDFPGTDSLEIDLAVLNAQIEEAEAVSETEVESVPEAERTITQRVRTGGRPKKHL